MNNITLSLHRNFTCKKLHNFTILYHFGEIFIYFCYAFGDWKWKEISWMETKTECKYNRSSHCHIPDKFLVVGKLSRSHMTHSKAHGPLCCGPRHIPLWQPIKHHKTWAFKGNMTSDAAPGKTEFETPTPRWWLSFPFNSHSLSTRVNVLWLYTPRWSWSS